MVVIFTFYLFISIFIIFQKSFSESDDSDIEDQVETKEDYSSSGDDEQSELEEE